MKIFYRIFIYLIAILIGLSIPVLFAYLDLWQLQIEPSYENMLDMFSSQNIYQFSTLFFPLAFVMISELIVQVQRKTHQLVEEFEYLKLLLNATPDALVFLNEDFHALFYNNQFKLLFNNFDSILKETKIKNFTNQVEFIQKEIRINSNLTEQHPFLMNFKLIKYKNRKNYFVSFKDLKNLRDKEQIIEDQKHQMIEKNKLASLGEMAAGIAHEINNPLTVIHSNNTLIKKLLQKNDLNPGRLYQLTRKTTDQVQRITMIITSLKNLSRGLANDQRETFSLDQVLEEAISLAKIKDKSKKIIFQFNNQKFKAFGNRGQIVQVVLNLLNNAIDAIEEMEDPWISLELKDNDLFVDLYITDSGNGINPELLEKIFIPMYTTKTIGKGTGLGLSLSKTFVEQNQGSLNYELNQSHTCFKVSLPKKELSAGDPLKKSA